MSIFKRNKGEKAPEPEYERKTNTERSIDRSKGRREKKTKEGLQELQEEEKKKNYKIILYFIGGGAPAGPGTRAVELNENSRKMIASGMMQVAEADNFETTPTGIKLMFNGRMLKDKKDAIMFGKKKMAKIETDDNYKYTVAYDRAKGQDGVEVMAYE